MKNTSRHRAFLFTFLRIYGCTKAFLDGLNGTRVVYNPDGFSLISETVDQTKWACPFHVSIIQRQTSQCSSYVELPYFITDTRVPRWRRRLRHTAMPKRYIAVPRDTSYFLLVLPDSDSTHTSTLIPIAVEMLTNLSGNLTRWILCQMFKRLRYLQGVRRYGWPLTQSAIYLPGED